MLCLCRFINDLSYTSDEMAHVAFPDESYTSGILPVSRREQNEVDDF